MSRKKKLINESGIPDFEIEKLARCFWPSISEDYGKTFRQDTLEWQETNTGFSDEPSIQCNKRKTRSG